jgi:hypothetical protein
LRNSRIYKPEVNHPQSRGGGISDKFEKRDGYSNGIRFLMRRNRRCCRFSARKIAASSHERSFTKWLTYACGRIPAPRFLPVFYRRATGCSPL